MQINLHGRRVNKRLIGKAPLVAGSASGTLQTKSVEPTTAEQVIIPDSGYEGLSRVNVGRVPLQAKTATPGAAAQVVEADEGAMGLSRVTVEGAPLQSKTVAPTTGTQTVEADAGYYGLGNLEVKAAKFQGKVVTPGTAQQFILPDEGYAGLFSVAILAEPDLIPENIRKGVTIFGVAGSYTGETSGEEGGDSGGGSGGDNTGGDNTGGDNTGGGTQTATMYSYNGTVLPALPEWDKETYPYAVIVYSWGGYLLYTGNSGQVPYVSGITIVFDEFGSLFHCGQSLGGYDYGMEKWTEEENLSSGFLPTIFSPVWSNFDLINQDDGELSMAKSEPIPVYE